MSLINEPSNDPAPIESAVDSTGNFSQATSSLLISDSINSNELKEKSSTTSTEGASNQATDETIEADLIFARELDRTLNSEGAAIKTEHECESDLEFARRLQRQLDQEIPASQENDVIDVTEPIETFVIPDEDDDDEVIFVDQQNTSRTPWRGLDQSAVNAARITFVIDELGITYNPATSFDWKKHDMKLNINAIFKRLNKIYFNEPKCFANTEIGWTDSLEDKPARLRLLADKIQISLNQKMKLLPRIDLITHVIRVMLIIYIREKYDLANDIPAFKRNFSKALRHINSVWMTDIDDNSVLKFNHEIDKRCWYRCTGMCQNRSPFYGIYRSKSEPGGQNAWWMTHRTICSATLFRLYEVKKYVDNQPSSEEPFYCTNTKHRSVKIDLKTANKHLLKPTAVIDLASSNYNSSITYMNDIIDIQGQKTDNSYYYGRRLDESTIDKLGFKPADDFIKLFDRYLGVDYNGYMVKCPLCEEQVQRRLFSEHFDGCMGFSQKVEYKPVTSKWDEWPAAKRIKY
uniref:CSON010542 protein n=1 Tax=Culicoides sonorensis TaxID=179676 RepID=A0A336LL67_CULSO